MKEIDENGLEDFIRENKDKFNGCCPNDNHEETFFLKLQSRIKEYISILPYLVRVAIATVIIFIASIIVWNNFIRKDRHEVTLKQKVTLIFTKAKNTVIK